MRLKDIEKEYNINFNENPNMKIETWLRNKGLKAFAQAFKKVKSLTKKNNEIKKEIENMSEEELVKLVKFITDEINKRAKKIDEDILN